MASEELNSGEDDIHESCAFCCIARGHDKEAEVVKKNDDLVCFKDISPASSYHYLVVPTQHIDSCLDLHRGHIKLVKRMAEMGKAVLREQGITDTSEIRLGFHQPPFISVNHLHLHVLAPISQISKGMLFKFLPETARFVTEESLQKQLEKNAPLDRHCFTGFMCLSVYDKCLNRNLSH